ncbi:MAG: hypothetical protein M3Z37_04490, partial [Candidatus Eremiobacteraeota bacterium]|nr:hypothetical protein [Candidatus Eremiobacteraeota bacterium]
MRCGAPGQRSDADVRKLLRLLRRPHLLERERLAILLRQAAGTATAREALLGVIDQIFGASHEGRRLHEIIQRCDMRGEKGRAAAAAMSLSLRQFFRYRVEAIQALASAIATRIDAQRGADHDLGFARMVAAGDADAALGLYVSAARAAGFGISMRIQEEMVRCAVWAATSGDDAEGPHFGSHLAAIELVERAGLALLGNPGRWTAAREDARAALTLAEGATLEHALFALTNYELLDARIGDDRKRCVALCAQLAQLTGSSERLHAL